MQVCLFVCMCICGVCLRVHVRVWERERVLLSETGASRTGRKKHYFNVLLTHTLWFFSISTSLFRSCCHMPGPGHYHILLQLLWVSRLVPILPPPKHSTLKYKHSCSCVTPWLKSDTFFIVYGKRYTFLHMLSKALRAPPAFLILCPFNVMRTWADCNHSSPSKSSCAFPGLSLPLTIEGPSTLSPYPNNIHSSEPRPTITPSMEHSSVPSPLKIISLPGAPTAFHFVFFNKNYSFLP